MKTQGSRLQFILKELNITAYRFSKILDYKSPDSIYHILKDKGKVSIDMQKRIREIGLNINENWIVTGMGLPFTEKPETNEVQFSFYLKKSLLKQLKIKAIEEDRSVKSIINESINEFLK